VAIQSTAIYEAKPHLNHRFSTPSPHLLATGVLCCKVATWRQIGISCTAPHVLVNTVEHATEFVGVSAQDGLQTGRRGNRGSRIGSSTTAAESNHVHNACSIKWVCIKYQIIYITHEAAAILIHPPSIQPASQPHTPRSPAPAPTNSSSP
jgi:hypothetical protein